MRKIATIGLAAAALTAAVLPALADDQSIGFATGMIGGPPPWAVQQAQTTWRPYGTVQRAAPYGDYAQYGDNLQSDPYAPRTCTYSGGPKTGTWNCP